MPLSDLLERKNNNLDIFRLLAASLVIYGHSNAIVTSGHVDDFVYRLIGYDYSGGLSVKLFFFLSGLVVTNSLIKNNSLSHFVISRVFRIFPALIVTIVISAIIIGPVLSSISGINYFMDNRFIKYIYDNIILNTNYNLPGLFSSNHSSTVNGSIWSIPYEVYCYLMLGCLYVFGVMAERKISTVIIFFIILDCATGNRYLFNWIPSSNHDLKFLPLCFSFGVLLSIWQDHIKINSKLVISSWVFYLVYFNNEVRESVFYVCFFMSVVYLSSTKLLLKAKIKNDFSYGIYLWGWPTQQIIISILPKISSIELTLMSVPICATLGLISWLMIEKPSILIGRGLINKINKYQTPRPIN